VTFTQQQIEIVVMGVLGELSKHFDVKDVPHVFAKCAMKVLLKHLEIDVSKLTEAEWKNDIKAIVQEHWPEFERAFGENTRVH